MGMEEFLGNLLRDRVVNREDHRHFARLQWIMLKGTAVFATADPAMSGEQRRYVDLCKIVGAAFSVLADDTEGIREMFGIVFGPSRFWPDGNPRIRKEGAQTHALFENRLNWWNDWEDSPAPIAWLKACAYRIHQREEVNGGSIRESDALYRTSTKEREEAPSSNLDSKVETRDVIALEAVSDMGSVAEAGLRPRYSSASISALEAAIRDDEELHAYAQLRHTGWKREDAADSWGGRRSAVRQLTGVTGGSGLR